MGTAEHYDVIIVGRTISGLLSAALLARRRFRVRVLEGPFPEHNQPLFALETAPALLRVLDELALVHDVRARLYAPPSAMTIALPDRRFSFEVEPQQRAREFSEMMPHSTDALLAFFEQVARVGRALDGLLSGESSIPLDGHRAQKAIDKHYRSGPWSDCLSMTPDWPEDAVVAQFVRALLAVGTRGVRGDTPFTIGALRTLWHLSHGMPSFRGGRQGLKTLLAQKLMSTGGTVEERRKVSHFEVRRNAIKAVVTTDSARFTTEAVILDGGFADLHALWSESEVYPENTVRQSYSMDHDALPTDLFSPCGWLPDPGGPAYAVDATRESFHVTGPLDAGAAPLNDLLPLHDIASIGNGQPTCRPIERLDPFGLFHQGARCSLKNLIFTGEQVLPDQGLESDSWTALNAADILTEALNKRWRFSAQI
ncbi:MAG: hypothetical protein VX589_11560 [Myxococcota bacterium]|nr:hypothetical protein [Myxococcota bacterium]